MKINRFLQLKVRGFTLVEGLVVVAILVVLAALALPIFGKLTKRSEMIQCTAHLRAMGVAAFSYASDHDGWLPGPTQGDQYAYYSAAHVETATQTSTNSRILLAAFVPYLGLPVPGEPGRRNEAIFPKIAECPTMKKAILAQEGAITKDNARYYKTGASLINDGTEVKGVWPFGFFYRNEMRALPMKMGALQHPTAIMGLRDREYGIHEGITNMLLMDGSVVGLRENQFDALSSGTVRLR